VQRGDGSEGDVFVAPVTPDRWDDLVALFERPGPRGGTPMPGHCWCMAFRGNPPSRPARKDGLHGVVERGDAAGLLAYRDGIPVGWVAIAPRDDYVGIHRSSTLRPRDGDEAVFAITCFYVDPDARGDGVSSALLDAAIHWAAACGASAVEAYPKASIAPHAEDDRRAEQNFSFMGRPGAFERRGFRAVREAGARVVVRLGLPALGEEEQGPCPNESA
jgi:GNAT superfamily N-acetyltransferase